MNTAFRISLPLSLLAAGILAGCQSEPTSPQSGTASAPAGADARQQAYARELHALKATTSDQKILEAKNLELLSKYGYPLPEKEPEPAPAAPARSASALAKAAANQSIVVKTGTGSIYRTFQDYVDLPDQSVLSLSVVARDAADPYLAAYLQPSGFALDYVCTNDDSLVAGNPLNSTCKWRNNTGSSQRVYYSVFASLNSARGLGDLSVAIDGQAVAYPGIRIGGTIKYQDDFSATAPAGCQTNPVNSQFQFQVNSGSNTVQLLAYSSVSAKGAEGGATSAGTSMLSAWIPSGAAKTAPSFVLMSRASTTFGYSTISGGYTYSQSDIFSCN